MNRTFRRFANLEELNQAAAQCWQRSCEQAVAERGFFSIALAGGSTPKKLYQLMAQQYKQALNWPAHHVFFGDERSVPLDHVDSNYAMAKQNLLQQVPVKHVYPMVTDPLQMPQAAQNYQQQLHQLFPEATTPSLDLVLLGMGDDGHTASLFPGTKVLNEQERWVAEVFVEKLNTWRLTLTYPLIKAAKQVLFLVTGENKADVLAQIYHGKDYPAGHVEARQVTWYVDAAAAANLPGDL